MVYIVVKPKENLGGKVMNDQNVTKQRNSRKKTTGILALLVAAVLLMGSLFAFFSDKLTGAGSVAAGTIELQATDENNKEGVKIYRWVDDENPGKIDETADENSELKEWSDGDILNPGDKLVLKGAVKNIGSKSAWLQSEVTLDVADGLDQYFKYYTVDSNNEIPDEGMQVQEDTPIKQVLGVLDGSIEDEEYSGANFQNGKASNTPNDLLQAYAGNMLVIEFSTSANNSAQGCTVKFDVIWKALQYRNNTVDTNLKWDDVEEVLP